MKVVSGPLGCVNSALFLKEPGSIGEWPVSFQRGTFSFAIETTYMYSRVCVCVCVHVLCMVCLIGPLIWYFSYQ